MSDESSSSEKATRCPVYADLEQSCNDILQYGFQYGRLMLTWQTKPFQGVECMGSASYCPNTGIGVGLVGVKAKLLESGVTILGKVDSNSTLCTTVDLEEVLPEGLRLAFTSSITPHEGKMVGQVDSGFRNDAVALTCGVNLPLKEGPLVYATGVLSYNKWLAGIQMSSDVSQSKVCSNFGLGYTLDNFYFYANMNNWQEFGGSIHQKVSDKFETAFKVKWAAETYKTTMETGCKYNISSEESFKVKVNNSSQIGLSYRRKLHESVILTLSAMINGITKFKRGGHSVGVALTFER